MAERWEITSIDHQVGYTSDRRPLCRVRGVEPPVSLCPEIGRVARIIQGKEKSLDRYREMKRGDGNLFMLSSESPDLREVSPVLKVRSFWVLTLLVTPGSTTFRVRNDILLFDQFLHIAFERKKIFECLINPSPSVDWVVSTLENIKINGWNQNVQRLYFMKKTKTTHINK